MMIEKQGTIQKFESKTVTFTIERKEHCIAECRACSSLDLVKKARKDAIQLVSKEVTIPGFRRGKAPSDFIVKKFPKSVEEKWQTTLADYTFHACQKVTHIPILNAETKIQFHIDKCSIDEGAEITFTFETEPTVPEIKIKGLELQEVKRESVDEKQIQKTLEDIQSYFAEWEKAQNLTIKEGDFAVINIELIDKDPPEMVLSKARFEVKKEKMAHWMYTTLLGMEVGTSREGVSVPDAETSQQEKEALPPRKVRLTLKEIQAPKYPPIDDVLAQKVGVKDVPTLKENLNHLLNKQADEAVQNQYREQITAHLLETYPFELPSTLRQKETETRLNQLAKSPYFLRKNEQEKREIIEQIKSQGEKALRLFYICKEIVRAHQIPMMPEERSSESLTPLSTLFQGADFSYATGNQEDQTAEIILSRLLLKKAEDFLISNAKIIPQSSQKTQVKKSKVAKPKQTPLEEPPTKKEKNPPPLSKKAIQEEYLT